MNIIDKAKSTLANIPSRLFFVVGGSIIVAGGAGIIVANTYLNKDIGCCIPTCEDKKLVECQPNAGSNREAKWAKGRCHLQTDCEKGCCYLNGQALEDIPKNNCQAKMGSWSKGKCGEGFSVHMEGVNRGQFNARAFFGEEMGKTAETLFKMSGQDMPEMSTKQIVDLYTCQDTIYSTWIGTIKTILAASSGKTTENTRPISITFNRQGTIKETGGSNLGLVIKFTATVDARQMSFILDQGGMMPNLTVSGPIVKGAKECGAQQ